jgi:hypothetical protein
LEYKRAYNNDKATLEEFKVDDKLAIDVLLAASYLQIE